MKSSHLSQQLSRLLLCETVDGKACVHGQGLFERLLAFFVLANRFIDLCELDRRRQVRLGACLPSQRHNPSKALQSRFLIWRTLHESAFKKHSMAFSCEASGMPPKRVFKAAFIMKLRLDTPVCHIPSTCQLAPSSGLSSSAFSMFSLTSCAYPSHLFSISSLSPHRPNPLLDSPCPAI